MTSRNRLFKNNGSSYSSDPFVQVRPIKVKSLRPDQQPGPVTITPGAASTREDEDADHSAYTAPGTSLHQRN